VSPFFSVSLQTQPKIRASYTSLLSLSASLVPLLSDFDTPAEMASLLLDHLSTHPSLSPTYILTGPLLPSSSLSSTQLNDPYSTQVPGEGKGSLRGLAGAKGMVRIVDMDEMSDGERNSEDGVWEGMEGEEEGLGNDEGDPAGIGRGKGGLGVGGVGREEEVLRSEQVARWGVVLVQGAGLEGLSSTGLRCGLWTDGFGGREESVVRVGCDGDDLRSLPSSHQRESPNAIRVVKS